VSGEYGYAAALYIYSAALVAAMIVTYVAFARSYRRMGGSGAASAPSIRYYFVEVGSREARDMLSHASRLAEGGDYAGAVRKARDAVAELLAEACRRLGVEACSGDPWAVARTLRERGYYLWPSGVRELEDLARKGPRAGRKDAARAIEIALRIMSYAGEIRVEPPREARAGKEGSEVPGGSRVLQVGRPTQVGFRRGRHEEGPADRRRGPLACDRWGRRRDRCRPGPLRAARQGGRRVPDGVGRDRQLVQLRGPGEDMEGDREARHSAHLSRLEGARGRHKVQVRGSLGGEAGGL
jgi:HEPN domain-containing protein